jgi:hypothetical protein
VEIKAMKRTFATFCIISVCLMQPAIAAPVLLSDHHTINIQHRLIGGRESRFHSANCTGSGINDICVAAGSEKLKSSPLPPYLFVSVDGGNTWNRKTAPNLPTVPDNNIGSLLEDVSCTRNADLCVVVGSYSFHPFVVVSHDKGSNWSMKYIADNLSMGEFTTISCSSGNESVCAAGGYVDRSTGDRNAMLAVSTDKGNSWQIKTIPNTPIHSISNVSCTGNGATATCSAIGQSFDEGSFVVMSSDGGNTWKKQVIPLSRLPFLYSTTCTGTESNTTCIVVGSDNHNPIVATTTDKGTTWNVKNVSKTDLSQYGVFDDTPLPGYTRCIGGRGHNAICTTVSNDDRIAISNDGGIHWEIKQII